MPVAAERRAWEGAGRRAAFPSSEAGVCGFVCSSSLPFFLTGSHLVYECPLPPCFGVQPWGLALPGLQEANQNFF